MQSSPAGLDRANKLPSGGGQEGPRLGYLATRFISTVKHGKSNQHKYFQIGRSGLYSPPFHTSAAADFTPGSRLRPTAACDTSA